MEKRLKLEHSSQTKPSTLEPSKRLEINNSSLEESLSLPIYIYLDQSNDNQISPTLQESSELPQAFLSCSPQFPPTHENPLHPNGLDHQENENENENENEAVDDIQQLIQLLGLSDYEQKLEGKKVEVERRVGFGCGSCHCEGGFYLKIAGVTGPKCGKEVERLESWIKYFLIGGCGEENGIEPLRLALLLLGKAAFVSGGGDCGFGGLDFPSAIEDFLMNDPPTS